MSRLLILFVKTFNRMLWAGYYIGSDLYSSCYNAKKSAYFQTR